MKILEPKFYIRINANGEPELIRAEPIVNSLGIVDGDNVRVYLDEEGPHELPRSAFGMLLQASSAVSLEEATNWKHRRVH